MASRMGFDLFTKMGWRNLLFVHRNKHSRIMWNLVFTDTFYQVGCWIFGHKPYTPEPWNNREKACKRCHKWIRAE